MGLTLQLRKSWRIAKAAEPPFGFPKEPRKGGVVHSIYLASCISRSKAPLSGLCGENASESMVAVG